MNEKVVMYYDANPQKEWDRTQRSWYAKLEFRIVLATVRKYIGTGARVIDFGCGPGTYTVPLAEMGCELTLVDISKNCIEYALAKLQERDLRSKIDSVFCGSVLEFTVPEPGMFDAALLFGPLYHLKSPADRQAALRVAADCVRPGGLVFMIFVSRFAILKDLAKTARVSTITNLLAGGYLEHGVYSPEYIHDVDSDLEYMPDAYGATVAEAGQLVRRCGLETLATISCESFLSFMSPYINQSIRSPEQFEKLAEIAIEAGQDPLLAHGADHFLIIARKPAP